MPRSRVLQGWHGWLPLIRCVLVRCTVQYSTAAARKQEQRETQGNNHEEERFGFTIANRANCNCRFVLGCVESELGWPWAAFDSVSSPEPQKGD